MSYGLIYTIPFASLRNEACVVEIEKEDYTGAATELIGAESPFDVDVDDNDFLYIPSRFSTARIRVVGSDYLQQLYSTAYQQYRVTFKRDGAALWRGFVKPEIYTQDYSSDKFELEIECQSAMSVLEYINYKQTGTDGRVFVPLWDLIKKCVESSRGQYAAVYIPHVYARDKREYDLGDNILEYMTISEQNFFDEDDKAMKLKEVLEEICKFLNWTCVDYLGSLYFIDSDHAGDYHCYDRLPNWNTFLTVSPKEVINVQKIGFSGAGHSYDRLNGYSKCTIKTSNYPVGDIFGYDDYSEMDVICTKDYVKDDGVCHKVFLNKGCVKLRSFVFDANVSGYMKEVTDISKMGAEELNKLYGAIPVRYCSYKVEDGKASIANYDYTDAVQIRQSARAGATGYFQSGTPIFSLKGSSSIYSDGALVITGSIKLCATDADMNPLIMDKSVTFNLAMQIRIGDEYYDFQEHDWFEVEKYPARYGIGISNSDGDDYVDFIKNKTLEMPYAGADGYIIPIKNKLLKGDIEIVIYAPTGLTVDYKNICGYYLKDFKVSFCKEDNSDKAVDNSDRYYENIVNEDYINELDEIEFKISSYNNDGACYSKVLLDDNYLTNNLYSTIVDKAIRPEEHLIQRIVNRYDATRIKLTQVIKETPELTPLTKLSDNFMVGKIFMPVGGSIDYKMGQYKCVMVEV